MGSLPFSGVPCPWGSLKIPLTLARLIDWSATHQVLNPEGKHELHLRIPAKITPWNPQNWLGFVDACFLFQAVDFFLLPAVGFPRVFSLSNSPSLACHLWCSVGTHPDEKTRPPAAFCKRECLFAGCILQKKKSDSFFFQYLFLSNTVRPVGESYEPVKIYIYIIINMPRHSKGVKFQPRKVCFWWLCEAQISHPTGGFGYICI